MRVLALTRYTRLGSTSRVRLYQYLPALAAEGVECAVVPFFDDGYIEALYNCRRRSWGKILLRYFERLRHLLGSARFDLCWIQQELLPWAPAWLERLLWRDRMPYVVDYDDAVYYRYNLHSSTLVRGVLAGKIEDVMRRARLVIAGNDYLAEHARAVAANQVEVVPSVVDLNDYQLRRQHPQGSTFTIGWLGSPASAQNLAAAAPALATMQRKGAQIVLVGAGPEYLPGISVEVRPWYEETQVADIQSFDVGIMPLFDQPFQNGKCGYKLIQYMACGVPVVASPVGVNRQIVQNGINGLWAQEPAEWISALEALQHDSDLRQRMGLEGRRTVAERYSLQVTAPRLIRLLREAAQRVVQPAAFLQASRSQQL